MEEKSLEELLEVLDQTDISYFSLSQGEKGKKRRRVEIFRKQSKGKEKGGETQSILERSENIFESEQPFNQEERKTFDILSPHVGFFFRSETMEGPALVKLREVVGRGTVLAFIQSMSVSYEVLASNEGKIVEILVETGQAVEYGQPLFRLRKMES